MQLDELNAALPTHLRLTPTAELDELLLELDRQGWTADSITARVTRAIETAKRPPERPGFVRAVLADMADHRPAPTALVIEGQRVAEGEQAPLGPWTSVTVHRFEQAAEQPLGVCRCQLPAMNRHHVEYLHLYAQRSGHVEPTELRWSENRVQNRPGSVAELAAAVRELEAELGRGSLQYVDPATVPGSGWTDEALGELACSCADMTMSLALSALGHELPSSLTRGCELHTVWARYAAPRTGVA